MGEAGLTPPEHVRLPDWAGSRPDLHRRGAPSTNGETARAEARVKRQAHISARAKQLLERLGG